MASLLTLPWPSQPHRVDDRVDPAFKTLFSMIDQMFAELYQDVQTLSTNITTVNTSGVSTTASTGGVTIAQVATRALHGV